MDIAAHYNKLIRADPSITPPIAAIESLIAVLSSSQLTTISETLSLVSSASEELLASQHDPIPLSAGTDLFQRYLITSFQQNPLPSHSGSDFTQLRTQLITNSKVFVSRAKNARSKIAKHALPVIQEDSTVLAYGNSQTVGAILRRAADAGKFFYAIFVSTSSSTPVPSQSTSTSTSTSANLAGSNGASVTVSGVVESTSRTIQHLKTQGIPVATIPLSALSYTFASLPKQSTSALMLVGAEAILENGAAVSYMGTHLVAEVSKANNIPLYVATGSYKFVRSFPLGYGAKDLARMGTRQSLPVFETGLEPKKEKGKEEVEEERRDRQESALRDITPPHLISGLITENGVMTTNAVAEELIKLWF